MVDKANQHDKLSGAQYQLTADWCDSRAHLTAERDELKKSLSVGKVHGIEPTSTASYSPSNLVTPCG